MARKRISAPLTMSRWARGASLGLVLGLLVWWAAGVAGEQSVPFTNVIELYEQGQHEQAREAARIHFESYHAARDLAQSRLDREAVASGLLGLTTLVLLQEGALPASRRFGGDMALLEQLSDELSKVERLLAQMAQGDYFEALAEARGVTYPTLAFGPPDGKPAVLAAGGELIFAFDLALLRQLSPRQIEVFEDESDGEDCYEVGTSVSPSGPFERVGRFCGRAVISLADREWIDFIRLADAADGGATVRIDAVKLGGETPRKPATRRAGGQLEVYLAQGVEAWLRAAQPLVPRAKLAGFYQTHRRVLASQGLASLDQILAPQPPVPDAKAALAVVPKTALMTRVRAYFEGLLAEDPVLLRQATGLDDAGIAALLASYHEDCADEGIEKLIRVTVPSAEEALEIMSQKAGAYAVTVHGVELEYVDREGVTRRRTINKHFRFRSLEGDWRILTTVQ